MDLLIKKNFIYHPTAHLLQGRLAVAAGHPRRPTADCALMEAWLRPFQFKVHRIHLEFQSTSQVMEKVAALHQDTLSSNRNDRLLQPRLMLVAAL